MYDAIVKIIWDAKKKKLRAVAANIGRYVRFPNNLRLAGHIYQVEELRQGKSGSWIACGRIVPLT